MKIYLSPEQKDMLLWAGIEIPSEEEYSEEQAFALLDAVYAIEVQYAQDADLSEEARQKANRYAAIADTIQNQIPEE